MAAHNIAIPKASFSASLLQPDPKSVPRDAIARFFATFDQAIAKGSYANIQTCKSWLLDNVVHSSRRTNVFGKYLAALSTESTDQGSKEAERLLRSSSKKRRLHILYLLNDLLHHTKYHSTVSTAHSLLSSTIKLHLVGLAAAAGSFDGETNKKHQRKLDELLDVWTQNDYYESSYMHKLREAVKSARNDPNALQTGEVDVVKVPAKNAPYVMPATHGDAALRWHDLPAGNLIPHIIPDSTAPIDPRHVNPLQLVAGPANESLANVVRDFLKDVDAMPNKKREYSIWDDDLAYDLDSMGHPLVVQGPDGKLEPKENRYGWSMAFCEIMKKRKRHGVQAAQLPGMQRGRSLSRSSSGSADSRMSSRPRMRQRSQSRPRSSVYPPRRSPPRDSSQHRRRHSSSRSRSRTRSRSPGGRESSSRDDLSHRPQFRQATDTHAPSHSPNGYNPFQQPQAQLPPRPQHAHQNTRQPPPGPLPPHLNFAHSHSPQPLTTPTAQLTNPFPNMLNGPPPPPQQYPASYFQQVHNFQLDRNGLPIPPPPPFHQGPWPPPPPPVASPGGGGAWQPGVGFGGGPGGGLAVWQTRPQDYEHLATYTPPQVYGVDQPHGQGQGQGPGPGQYPGYFGGGLPPRGGGFSRGGGRSGVGGGGSGGFGGGYGQ